MKLFKRGTRWWVDLSKDGKRLRKSLGPEIITRAQAEAVLRALKKDALEEKLARLDPSGLTIDQFLDRFLADQEGFLAVRTLDRYRSTFTVLARDLGPTLPLRNVTARKIEAWAQTRLKTGVTAEGVNADLRHIKAALRKAAKLGWLPQAPEVRMVKTPRRLPRHLSPEAVEKLISSETDPTYKRLWSFLVWTGLRRSEALNLRWQDITWSTRPLARVVGKGDKERVVPLLPAAVEALGSARKDIGPIWPQIHPDRVSHRFKLTARRAGLGSARLHDLRHTCFTWLVSKGIHLKVVQMIAGHSSIQVTMLYAQTWAGDLYDELARHDFGTTTT
jgi:integrase